MSDDAALLIPIQFSLEEARAALAQLEAQARAAGKSIGEGFGKGASGGLEDLKKGMGKARETAMFFTQALGEFGPTGRTAQIALSGVVGGFLGGGGVLAALGLAQAGVRLFTDAWDESSRQALASAQLSKEAAKQMAAEIKSIGDQVEAQLLKNRGGTGAMEMMRAELIPARKLLEKEIKALASAEEDLAIVTSGKNVVDGIIQINMTALEAKQNVQQYTRSVGDLAAKVALLEAKAKALLAGEEGTAAADARKAAQEARKALVAEFAGDITAGKEEYAAKAQALMLAAQEAGLDERAKVELEHQRTMAGLREGDVASQVAAMVIRDAKLDALDKQHYEADYQRFYESLDRKARAFEKSVEERKRKEEEVKAAILSVGQELARDTLEGLMGSLIHANLANSRYTAQYNALASAQRAQMLLQRGAAKSLAEAQTMVASEAAAAKAAEAAATKASEAEKLKAMAIGWALQAAVAAVPFGPSFNPAVAAVYGSAAVAAGVAAGSLASAATHQAQGRGFTAQENDSLAGMKGTAVSSGGSRGYGAGSSPSGTVTIRETIYIGVTANDFESPAETARRASRVMALAERLDMGRRAS